MRTAAARLGPAFALAAAACSSSSGGASTDGGSPTADVADVLVVQVDSGCGSTQADPHNCGGCGIDCEGGICVEGVCSAAPPGVLASGQQTPLGIVIDDASVYWMDVGSQTAQPVGTSQVMKCPKTGCGGAPTMLASGEWPAPTRLGIYAGTLYWAAKGVLLSCSTDGCPAGPTVLSTGNFTPTDLAAGAAGIFVGASEQQALLQYVVPDAGTDSSVSPVFLWSQAAPDAIAIQGTTVYFATAGVSLVSCDVAAVSCVKLLPGGQPTALAAAGTDVYIGTQSSVMTGGANSAEIASCPEANCLAGLMTLTSRVTYVQGIAADGTSVYFSDRGAVATLAAGGPHSGIGRVAKCPLAGCTGSPTPIAGFVNYPQQIAVDDKNVYWTDFGSSTDPTGTTDGRVMTSPK